MALLSPALKTASARGALAIAGLCAVVSVSQAQEAAGPIQDNSFFIEEAYNQDWGVVQHINTFMRAKGGDWGYGLTQEWPLGGMHHQISYTIPVVHGSGAGTGLGDVALNYRYQLVGHPDARLLIAPRATVLFPTGDEKKGRGTGGVGFQAALPVTYNVAPQLATHWNAGFTLTPSAKSATGDKATTFDYSLGASAIWLVRPTFNLMLETVWVSTVEVVADGITDRSGSTVTVAPGVRWAVNLPSGLQIVPGVAYAVNVGPDDGPDALFLYLSFEHSFRHRRAGD